MWRQLQSQGMKKEGFLSQLPHVQVCQIFKQLQTMALLIFFREKNEKSVEVESPSGVL